METKQEIRNRLLMRREALSEQWWKTHTNAVIERVLAHPSFVRAELLFCYVDTQREVGTRSLLLEALRQGKRVAVPKVNPDKKSMQFYQIFALSDLREGAYHLFEPEAKAENLLLPTIHCPSLLIMPGIAFDKELHRLGHGGGYYDRFLSQYQALETMALAFDTQIVDHIPAEETDIKPDWLLTETRSMTNGRV